MGGRHPSLCQGRVPLQNRCNAQMLLHICSLLPTNGWTSAASPGMDNRSCLPTCGIFLLGHKCAISLDFPGTPPPTGRGSCQQSFWSWRERCVNVLCAGATPAEGIPRQSACSDWHLWLKQTHWPVCSCAMTGRDLSSSFCVERQDSH